MRPLTMKREPTKIREKRRIARMLVWYGVARYGDEDRRPAKRQAQH
jgi:hypothetical protein